MSYGTDRGIPQSTKMYIFFHGFLKQFGWTFFGFGMIFFWIFVLNADLSFIHFNGKIVTVEVKVTNTFETNASVNEASVYENHYKFIDENGIEFEEFSYSTGSKVYKGDKVLIEYPEGKPQYSRIKGMRREMFGPFVLFVAIFPLIGLLMILIGLRKYSHTIKLLKNGIISKGKLISKESTNITINDSPVYKLTFSFKDKSGKEYKVSENSHESHLLEDDDEEELLYLEENPEKAIMVDSLPGAVSINSKNEVEPSRSIMVLILPFIVIMGHGLFIFLYF